MRTSSYISAKIKISFFNTLLFTFYKYFAILFLPHILIVHIGEYYGKNVFSRLYMDKCVVTLRGAFFGVFLNGTRFFIGEKLWKNMKDIAKNYFLFLALSF